ncbi:hypothetical protein AB0K51_24100 [Kitasatospora sp. NPDC049285]|uniref:hypothetical protein n=1 Tax=Kitasatospora sp. NPDC049285 TaxID=3157096 RepID=UPI00344282E9
MRGAEAACDDDRPEFGIPGERRVGGLVPARPVSTGVKARAVLELHRNHGGQRAVALLGGEFVPGEGDRLAWQVGLGEPERFAPLPGLLPGALQPGLPDWLGETPVTGLRPHLDGGALPAGRLVIDRAGYDRESSPLLFVTAARLLLHVLLARACGAPAGPIIATWAESGRTPLELPGVG